MLEKTKKTLHNRGRDLSDKADAVTQGASAPQAPSNSKFFKSPTAPAGSIVGMPKPPADMIKKNQSAAEGKTRLTTQDKKY
jgi:hypothetical protein